jgi:DNA-binding transcriptional MocR family regulator
VSILAAALPQPKYSQMIKKRRLMDEPLAVRKETLYESLAGELARLVQVGTLRPGDRLPSVRRMSQQKNLSLTTVLQAYQVLEDQGVIEARPQSGYYVRPAVAQALPAPEVPASLPDPEHVQVDELVMRVVRDAMRPGLVQFGAALPAPELLPTARINRILARIARDNVAAAQSVGLPEGMLELRTQVARRTMESGCALEADDFVITCGCAEAIHLALQATCRPGDLVAVESPTYFGILQALEAQGLRALEIPTHALNGMSIDALSFALENHPIRAVVAITNFSNPLGCCMPEENKRALVELLARYQVPLIEDDIYGELSFSGHRPGVAKVYDQNGLVLLCSSFTKDISPSFRVGWIAPGRYLARVEQLKMATNIATSVLPQLAIATFLESGGYDRHLRTIRRAYAQKVAQMAQAVLHYFPAGTRVTSPAGGFVIWVQLPNEIDSLVLYQRALAAGITLAPGYIFSATPKYRSFIRLNAAYMNFAGERALARLGDMVGGL